eukprot:TRINITY_DN532_c2_g1_i2.p1 TRINITY_DN532_c2_g1~~TRINITY_DN532_c2_g1_i2.p1  ORF type:complete len:177 (+),score=49.41 TRINITY_DN532_c2_g1_i2:888-1418(+)
MTPHKALQIVNEILELMERAMTSMIIPSNASSSAAKTSTSSGGLFTFTPQLPPEIVIDFKIKDKMLLVTSLHLKPLSKQQQQQLQQQYPVNTTSPSTSTPASSSQSPVLPPSTSSSPTPGRNNKIYYSARQNQLFEIIDQYQIECEVKKLDSIFHFLQKSYTITQNFKEKLTTLLN